MLGKDRSQKACPRREWLSFLQPPAQKNSLGWRGTWKMDLENSMRKWLPCRRTGRLSLYFKNFQRQRESTRPPLSIFTRSFLVAPSIRSFQKTSFVRNLQVRGWRGACSFAKKFNGRRKRP